MKRKIILSSVICIAAVTFSIKGYSQSPSFSFFLDNYSFSYRINPALVADKSFFALCTDISTGIESDLGVSSLLYPDPNGNGLVTGFNSAIPSEEFLSHFNDVNEMNINYGMSLFAIGVRKQYSMTTFELNLRAMGATSVPGDLFRFLKNGSQDSEYDLTGTSLNAQAFAEIAYGHAQIYDAYRLTFGFRIKGLVGIAGADFNAAQAALKASDTEISAQTDITARVAAAPLTLSRTEDGKLAAAFNPSKILPGGYGLGLDLGLTWEPFKDFTISAAITDLGAIKWNYNNILKSNASQTFKGVSLDEDNSNIQEEIDNIKANLDEFIDLHPVAGSESTLSMLPFTANAGIKYKFPHVRVLSVGAFGSYTNGCFTPSWDVRAGATLTPWKGLSLTGNYGYSNHGNVFGAALSMTLLGLNFFVGVDGYLGPVGSYASEIKDIPEPLTKAMVYPINDFRYKVNFGFALQLGKRY